MEFLKLKKSKLNNAFEGYKLSNADLHIKNASLSFPVNSISTRFYTTSYLFSKSAQEFNHLFCNWWNGTIFCFDEKGCLWEFCSSFNSSGKMVKRMQLPSPASEEKFAFSVHFTLQDLAVVFDGAGKLYLIKIENFNSNKCWRLIDKPVINLNSNGYLISSEVKNSHLYITTLLLNEISDVESNKGTEACLQVLIFKIGADICSDLIYIESYSLSGSTLPHICWLSDDASKLFYVSEKNFSVPNEEANSRNMQADTKLYKWHQTKELVVLSIEKFPIVQDNVIVNILSDHIDISVHNGNCDIVKIFGSLEKEIVVDASKWYVDNGRLEVALLKKNVNEFWSEVIKGDCSGVHVVVGEEEEKLSEIHQRLAHLTSDQEKPVENDGYSFNMQQLEECDETTEDVSLYEVSLKDGTSKTLKNFGNRQILFKKNFSIGETPVLCFRNDFDGIVWRTCDQGWEHMATLDAFGYVMASKTEQKFVGCSPSFTYSYITDHSGNVYIYEGYLEGVTNVRTKKQYIASCRPADSVIGCQATDDAIFVLTSDSIFVINLP